MNEISLQICSKDPTMLLNHKKLLEASRKQLHESGYHYKKGKSRSKVLRPTSLSFDTTTKRLSEEVRCERMGHLQEDIKDIADQISFKEKRRDVASNVHDYKQCEDLTEEIMTLKAKKRQSELEYSALIEKQKKSNWYKSKKYQQFSTSSIATDTGTTDDEFSTSSSPHHLRRSSSIETLPPSETTTISLTSDSLQNFH